MDIDELIARLISFTIDYDGTKMPNAAEPINNLTCGEIREIVQLIRDLQDDCDGG